MSDVTVQIGAETTGAVGPTNAVTLALKAMQESVGSLNSGFARLGSVLQAAFTVGGVVTFVNAMTELAYATSQTAAQLGVAEEAVAGLNLLAKDSGTDLGGLTQGLTKLESVLTSARRGSQEAADDLKSLGLSAKDFVGLDTAGKIDLLAEKFEGLKDSTEKTAIATALLGRAGAQLIPFLNEGRGGIAEYNAMVDRTGTSMKGLTAAFQETGFMTLELGESFRGVMINAFAVLRPGIESVITAITDMTQNITKSIKEGGAWKAVLEAVSAEATEFAKILAMTAHEFEVVYAGAVLALRGVAEFGDTFIEVAKALANFDPLTALGRIVDGLDKMEAPLKAFHDRVAESRKRLAATLEKIDEDSADAKEENDKKADAKRIARDAEALAAKMRDIETEIAISRQGLQQKSVILDTEVRLGRMTQQQKFAALAQYTEEAYQFQLAALQREAALEALKPSQRAAINGRIRQLEVQHQTEMLQLNLQAVSAMAAQWRQYTDAITGAINNQLRGLITMQTSWAQAMKNILLDVGLQMITLLVTKPLSEFLAAQAAMLFAKQSTAAGMVATEATAQAATLPLRAGKFVSDITANAAAAFAGVFANLAPFLGPAAAGPAAAAQGTVLAQLANIPKFDVGSWSVPGTGLAVVHAGETILPAGAPAEAYRNQALGGGQGGGNVFQIMAWDGASVDSWLRSGGAEKLARATASVQNRNRSTRPSY